MNTARLLSASAIFFIALGTHAATISIQVPADVPVGTPFTVTVMLDTGADTPNALDGSVHIPAGIDVRSVDTGGSLLALWPIEPVYRVVDGSISFAGGKPGGLAPHASGALFSISAVAESPGAYRFSTANVNEYANDGKGTRTALLAASGSTAASANAVAPAGPAPDTTAPVFTSVAIGQDPSLFDNKFFASFYATDAGSGIDHYEVKEGWWRSFTRADRYYVLKDQSLETDVTVRAVDVAGNAVSETIPAAHPWPHRLFYLALIAIVIGVIYAVRRRRK